MATDACLRPERGFQPGTEDGEDVAGLHGLRVVEAMQHPDIPAELFELGAPGQQRPGNADPNVAPAFAVVDLIVGTGDAQPRTGELRLGRLVVEPSISR